ncbi:hypothetical protein NM688_g7222 [Phlebia brevispora]|uniref:Uncharacterized protein n=1 Tax=Phlebia brevispora TaxID=194682 RepID=A0ACC1S7V1_9APHY|nr:hypothetical protein NM688_g7222 [Phlebia brevispora]
MNRTRTDSTSSNQTPFEWLPEYDGLLEQIASTDIVDAEWTRLREIIKHKLDKNISLYLIQSNEGLTPAPSPFSPHPIPAGGLKLPPFGPRPPRADGKKFPDPPKAILTSDEAKEFKESIYAQLNEFDGAPFTIQRVCELCLHPKKHYKYLGKYLRAVEKSLLVTSTWDSFPLPIEGETHHNGTVPAPEPIANTPLSSAPSTPMFSPIPFLHDDARRSQSRSPPPSPLMLAAIEAPGLVDELDDPSPGHLSDHPHPISSTTTVDSKPSKPFLGSLGERFTKPKEEEEHPPSGSGGEEGAGEPTAEAAAKEESKEDEMMVDDPEKENKAG